MKTLPFFKAILMALTLTLLIGACKEQDSLPRADQSTNFFVRDVSRKIVAELDPQVLGIVRKDLLSKGRTIDAENLLKTYDAKSGKLFSTVVLPTKNARISASYSVTFDAYGAFVGGISDWMRNVPLGGLVGTTGKQAPMFGFQVNSNPVMLDSPLFYQAHMSGFGWTGTARTGQYCGVTSGRRVEAVRFYGNPSLNTNLSYRAHVAAIGWLPWVGEGQIAGTTGESRRLEAFEVMMLVY